MEWANGEVWFDLGQVDRWEKPSRKATCGLDGQGAVTLDLLSLSQRRHREFVRTWECWVIGTRLWVIVVSSRVLGSIRDYDLGLVGRMAIDVQIGGTLMNPKPAGRVAIWDTQYAGWPLGVGIPFRMGSERLRKQKPSMVHFRRSLKSSIFSVKSVVQN